MAEVQRQRRSRAAAPCQGVLVFAVPRLSSAGLPNELVAWCPSHGLPAGKAMKPGQQVLPRSRLQHSPHNLQLQQSSR